MLDLPVGVAGLTHCVECGVAFALVDRHPGCDATCTECLDRLIRRGDLTGPRLRLILECESCCRVIVAERWPDLQMDGWRCKQCVSKPRRETRKQRLLHILYFGH